MSVVGGLHNFRDTGGTALRAGGETRAGVLYRSDALGTLTDAGLEVFAETPIGVVVDFRTPHERAALPDRLPAGRPYRTVDLSILEGAMGELAQQVMASGAPLTDDQLAAIDAGDGDALDAPQRIAAIQLHIGEIAGMATVTGAFDEDRLCAADQ